MYDHAGLLGKRLPPPPQVSADGNTVPIVNSMTQLGIKLSPSLKWDQHVEGLICRINGKGYFLAVLRRAGVGVPHLITFYTVFIRPTLEYAALVWHSGPTQRLSDDLERVQRLCLHTIQPELGYSKALAALDPPQLCARLCTYQPLAPPPPPTHTHKIYYSTVTGTPQPHMVYRFWKVVFASRHARYSQGTSPSFLQ